MCQVGHNITGGWAITPGTCAECKARQAEYRRVVLPQRLKMIEDLERRAGIWEQRKTS